MFAETLLKIPALPPEAYSYLNLLILGMLVYYVLLPMVRITYAFIRKRK